MRGGRGAVVALAGQEPVRIGARIDPEELILLVAAAVLAVMAAAVHILIFYMESIAWEGALARKTFGGTPEEARPHAFYAYNQGFYNLFLAHPDGGRRGAHALGGHSRRCGPDPGRDRFDAGGGTGALHGLSPAPCRGAQAGRLPASGDHLPGDRTGAMSRDVLDSVE